MAQATESIEELKARRAAIPCPALASNAKEQQEWDLAWQAEQKTLADDILQAAVDARDAENARRAVSGHSGKYTMCSPHFGWEGMMWSCCLCEDKDSTRCRAITDSSYGHTAPTEGGGKLCAGGCGRDLGGWDNAAVARCSRCVTKVQILGEKAHGEEGWWS